LDDACKSIGECSAAAGKEYVECRNSKCVCKIGSKKEKHPDLGKICVNSSVKNNLSKLSIIFILTVCFAMMFC